MCTPLQRSGFPGRSRLNVRHLFLKQRRVGVKRLVQAIPAETSEVCLWHSLSVIFRSFDLSSLSLVRTAMHFKQARGHKHTDFRGLFGRVSTGQSRPVSGIQILRSIRQGVYLLASVVHDCAVLIAENTHCPSTHLLTFFALSPLNSSVFA